jgi:hypothetical protein
MDQEHDLVAVLRSAARIGSSDDRGVLEWRQLLERAAAEISRLRSDLAEARGGERVEQPAVVDVRAR